MSNKRRNALVDQLLDELNQISEDSEMKAKVVEAIGQYKTNCITELVDAINEADQRVTES